MQCLYSSKNNIWIFDILQETEDGSTNGKNIQADERDKRWLSALSTELDTTARMVI